MFLGYFNYYNKCVNNGIIGIMFVEIVCNVVIILILVN